jgi:hypothetical protein
MTTKLLVLVLAALAGCAAATPTRDFPLRDPFTIDTDMNPVSLPCRPDPSKKEPNRIACTPKPYETSYRWDAIDKLTFEQWSRALSIDVSGEAANANSLDEVADSSWFENRIGAHPIAAAELAAGACKPEDFLDGPVRDGEWVIDQGKQNGSTPGFRVVVPGKGKYLLKADFREQPERSSGASVIGAALFHAAGFSTTCEQVVYIRRSQLTLPPGLTVRAYGASKPFDEAALDKVLASSAHRGGLVRMQASKWLPGYSLGPFRYESTRADDPNDIIRHEARRELRGSRLLAAWLNHWDSREQNTMDVWLANDSKKPWSSPGYVRHYLIDTSDSLGQPVLDGSNRAGWSYGFDPADIFADFVTFGIPERPWDRAEVTRGHERFGYFSARDFDPATWKGSYPNPAFLRMTERDAAWMARIIARFTEADVRTIVAAAKWSDPTDTEYLTGVLIARQRIILARYLTRLSPIADVHRETDGRICGVDLARLRQVVPADRFRYTATEESSTRRIDLAVTAGPGGVVCVVPQPIVASGLSDDAPGRRVMVRLRNNVAGPLEIHMYDLGARGMRIVGLTRPAP